MSSLGVTPVAFSNTIKPNTPTQPNWSKMVCRADRIVASIWSSMVSLILDPKDFAKPLGSLINKKTIAKDLTMVLPLTEQPGKFSVLTTVHPKSLGGYSPSE